MSHEALETDANLRTIARLERENAALIRTLDVITRAGDIDSARNLARGVLERLSLSSPPA